MTIEENENTITKRHQSLNRRKKQLFLDQELSEGVLGQRRSSPWWFRPFLINFYLLGRDNPFPELLELMATLQCCTQHGQSELVGEPKQLPEELPLLGREGASTGTLHDRRGFLVQANSKFLETNSN